MFNIRVVNGIMYDIDKDLLDNTKERIQELVYDLCQNPAKDLRRLQCGDDIKCLSLRFTPVMIEECTNSNFSNQIREIEEMIGFPKFNVTFEDLQSIIKLPRTSSEFISQDNNTKLISYTGLCVSAFVISIFGLIVYKLNRKTPQKNTEQDKLNADV